ncbi:MAG: formylglycine-generating enzyme family protein, partial [Nitrospira sp.]|nr:formylglycine-generating enzyme family protein [Nitrospira sp.]
FKENSDKLDVASALNRWQIEKRGVECVHEKDAVIEWPEDKSPYPGLEWFTQEYAPLFFGRDQEVKRLVEMLNRPDGRFLIVSGPSGSGKSSLVGAGLWQALIKDGQLRTNQYPQWLRITPADDRGGPFLSLAAGLLHVFPQIPDRKAFASTLASKPTAFVEHITRRLSRGQELVLFVDGLEELFTQTSLSGDIQSFLSWLVTKSGEPQNRLRVVVTVQTEYLERLKAESQKIQQMIDEGLQLAIGPVSPPALREMIEKPACETNYKFESDLVDRILKDVDGVSNPLPLVGYVLKQLFVRQRDRIFRHDQYEAMGRVMGAIGYKADEEVKALGAGVESSLHKVFAELVYSDQSRPPMGKRARMAQFRSNEGVNSLIEKLSQPDCRVLVVSGEGDEQVVEVAHEKLLEAWPKLAEWLRDDNNKAFLIWKQQLRVAISKYEENKRDPDQLLRKLDLSKALDFVNKHQDWISQEEYAFINASRRRQLKKKVRVAGCVLLAVLGIWGDGWFRANEYRASEQRGLRILAFFMNGSYPLPMKPEMVKIPGGSFCMGDDVSTEQRKETLNATSCNGDQKSQDAKKTFEQRSREQRSRTPRHWVTVSPFQLGKYEVTFKQYDQYAIAKGERLPSDQGRGRGDQPVMDVTWKDAEAYAEWLSKKTGEKYRLPSEAEWEYAARHGNDQELWAGTSTDSQLDKYAWFIENSKSEPREVGKKEPNNYGLYDLSGNVWEWVQDCLHGTYDGAPSDGSAWLEENKGICQVRMIRGGSWFNDSELLRTFERGRLDVKSRTNGIGFRLAQDIDGP